MALFGCVWFGDFAAWHVQRGDRLLAYTPFFIHQRGLVIGASDLAREAGIVPGWTCQRAESLVPEAESIPFDPSATDYSWGEVLGELYQHTPRIEAVRPGLALFEVPPSKAGQQALADWVKDGGAHCGVAESRLLAELAAYHCGSGLVTHVPPKSARTFLKCLPVTVLAHAGLTENTLQRLPWFGWDTIGAMRETEERHLQEQFEDGRLLARFAAADTPDSGETAPVTTYEPPVTIGARINFDEPATEPCEWEPAYPELLERLCRQLHGREGASLTLIAATSRGRKVATCLLREPLRDARRLHEPTLALSRSLLQDGATVHGLELELGSLVVHLHQAELFDNNRKRHERLLESVRQLQSRGVATIKRVRLRDAFAVLEEDRYETVPWLDGLAGANLQRQTPSRQVAL